jgi:ribosome biogenesis GTPase
LDLPDFDALLARLAPYARLGYPIVPLAAKRDASPLVRWLEGQRTVLIGQSGMGKSTILNAVAPHAAAKTASIRRPCDRPPHDVALDAPYAAGRTPWVDRRFAGDEGLRAAHLRPTRLRTRSSTCGHSSATAGSRDCRHDREPGCAVSAAVEGRVAPHRVALLYELMAASLAVRAPGR